MAVVAAGVWVDPLADQCPVAAPAVAPAAFTAAVACQVDSASPVSSAATLDAASAVQEEDASPADATAIDVAAAADHSPLARAAAAAVDSVAAPLIQFAEICPFACGPEPVKADADQVEDADTLGSIQLRVRAAALQKPAKLSDQTASFSAVPAGVPGAMRATLGVPGLNPSRHCSRVPMYVPSG